MARLLLIISSLPPSNSVVKVLLHRQRWVNDWRLYCMHGFDCQTKWQHEMQIWAAGLHALYIKLGLMQQGDEKPPHQLVPVFLFFVFCFLFFVFFLVRFEADWFPSVIRLMTSDEQRWRFCDTHGGGNAFSTGYCSKKGEKGGIKDHNLKYQLCTVLPSPVAMEIASYCRCE